MSFAIRSATNTLATPDNLKRWKKAKSNICQMCKQPNRPPAKGTLHHILNNCPAFLDDRYKWRHDSIITYLIETIKEGMPSHLDIYADIAGHRIAGVTIPPQVIVTIQKPDLVLIDSSTTPTTVYLFELTVSFERNITLAHQKKRDRYTQLQSDIQSNGYICHNVPFEVGSRGHITKENRSTLTTLYQITKPKPKLKCWIQNISKISLLCSYSIFISRTEEGFGNPPPLRPHN